MLELKQIDVYYGNIQALWEVSLSVKEGEVTVIVGSNGAGKSTILRSISGMNRLRKGSIEFDSKRIDLPWDGGRILPSLWHCYRY